MISKFTTNENDSMLGVARVNIVNFKNLNSDTLDVKITCLESGVEYIKINNCKNINYQIFYIPIHVVNKELKIKVYGIKSVSLGSYILDTKVLIKGKNRDSIKPKSGTLRILPRPNIHFDADFYPFSNNDFTTKSTFSKPIIFSYKLRNLIAYKSQDDSFKLEKLANLFNCNSKDELIKAFTADEKVKVDDNVLIAALFKASLCNEEAYINHVMWAYENYSREIVTDFETEDQLYDLAKEFVIKHFKTNGPSWVRKAIVQSTTKIQETPPTNIIDACRKGLENFVDGASEKIAGNFTAFNILQLNATPDNAMRFVSQDQHKEQSEKAKKYLIEELKDVKLVEEILTTSEKIIVDQSVKKGKEDAVSTIKSSTTTEKAKEIVSTQKEDGSLELPDTFYKELDVESITEVSMEPSIQTYISDKLKSISQYAWETALSLITSQSQDQHKEQSTSEMIIVEQSVKKEDAVATIKSSTTIEKVKEIISCQKDDGSLELTDTVSKGLVESNESLITSIKTYFGNKLPDNKKLLDTAITLSFLRKTSSTDTSPELKEKYEKAEKYLKTELGSDEKVKELLEITDTIVIDHATKKIIKEKADQSVIEEIQETIAEEETTEVIEIQNNEDIYEKISDKITEKLGTEVVAHDALSCQKNNGSLQLSDTISKELKFESTDSLVFYVKSCLEEEVPENIQLLHTAITLSFLRKTSSLSTYSPELKEKYEKAEEYLKIQLECDEKFKKLMGIIDTIIISKRATKEAEGSVTEVH